VQRRIGAAVLQLDVGVVQGGRARALAGSVRDARPVLTADPEPAARVLGLTETNKTLQDGQQGCDRLVSKRSW
jgi:hypothetical protein